jgi:hypothetical protein
MQIKGKPSSRAEAFNSACRIMDAFLTDCLCERHHDRLPA